MSEAPWPLGGPATSGRLPALHELCRTLYQVYAEACCQKCYPDYLSSDICNAFDFIYVSLSQRPMTSAVASDIVAVPIPYPYHGFFSLLMFEAPQDTLPRAVFELKTSNQTMFR